MSEHHEPPPTTPPVSTPPPPPTLPPSPTPSWPTPPLQASTPRASRSIGVRGPGPPRHPAAGRGRRLLWRAARPGALGVGARRRQADGAPVMAVHRAGSTVSASAGAEAVLAAVAPSWARSSSPHVPRRLGRSRGWSAPMVVGAVLVGLMVVGPVLVSAGLVGSVLVGAVPPGPMVGGAVFGLLPVGTALLGGPALVGLVPVSAVLIDPMLVGPSPAGPVLLDAVLFGAVLFGSAGVGAGVAARRVLARMPRGAHVRAPVCEAALAVAWAGTGAAWCGGLLHAPWVPGLLGLAWLAVAGSVVDVLHHRLPDALTRPAWPAAFLVVLPLGPAAVGRAAAGAAVALVLHAAVHRAAPGALGGGDVKLAGPLGAVLAAASWPALALAGLLAAVLSAALAVVLLAAGRAGRAGAVPHGPSMLVATWLVLAGAAVGGGSG